MFQTIHQQATLSESEFKRLMVEHKKALLKTVRRFVPAHKKAALLAERFEKYGESYFRFIEDSSIEATNNIAEREIRTLVLDRMVTQGVRSDRGNEWHERLGTMLATCKKLGMNVMPFLRESLFRWCQGLAPPSLLSVGEKK
jgi:predicted metal-dependent hydrolase